MVFLVLVGSQPLMVFGWHKDACLSFHCCSCCQRARWYLQEQWEQVFDWLKWGELHPTYHWCPSLSFGLNAMMSSKLLIACRLVHPLPLGECYWCRSFLWHSCLLLCSIKFFLGWWMSCCLLCAKLLSLFISSMSLSQDFPNLILEVLL
jgi:hypothetical protein